MIAHKTVSLPLVAIFLWAACDGSADTNRIELVPDTGAVSVDASSLADAASNDGSGDTGVVLPPQRITSAADTVQPARSLCRTLMLATDGVGVYRVDHIDFEPREGGGTGALLARIILVLQQSMADGTPERVEAVMPVTLWGDGTTVSGELAIGTGDDFILLVYFQTDPENQSILHNATNPLLNHLTFIPMEGGEWQHPAWAGCGLSTDELQPLIAPMLEYLSTWDPNSEQAFECPGDRFAIEPGSGTLQADCGD
jgi:hypothetical protein